MKVGIYTRISTKKPEQEHGAEAQERACLEFGRRLFPDGSFEIIPDQMSGRKSNRPGLRRALHLAAMHKIQAILVFRLDRLSRGGIREMLRVIDQFEGYGCKVHSVSEFWWNPNPDSPVRELILAVLAWAADFESRAIGERVRAGYRARLAEAKERGKPLLWGMAKRSKWVGTDLPNQVVYRRKLGLSWAEIAEELGLSREAARRAFRWASPLGLSLKESENLEGEGGK